MFDIGPDAHGVVDLSHRAYVTLDEEIWAWFVPKTLQSQQNKSKRTKHRTIRDVIYWGAC